MFGLLYTGDFYQSQTEYLVASTSTYLDLCYQSACAIYELAKESKELLKTRCSEPDRLPIDQVLDENMGARYEELAMHSCTTKLYVTFSLESFINSLIPYLINQRILIHVDDEVKDLVLHNMSRLYDRLSTLDKWEEVAQQFGRKKLNKYSVLWKKVCRLYRYRDSMVHDKPVFILRSGDAVRVKRGMLAQVQKEEIEPMTIAQYMNDAYQACKAHDDIIQKIYDILSVEKEEKRRGLFILPRNYHRKIKNIIKKIGDLEQEISQD
ncbi:hypothetical protein NVS47_00485 [Dehalobacterium formicoaceticum]|uniref:Cthe-2314-like HEPN domain-containing protein n=1 Tax=Dehalobacterium formicoaceticum TaxID=51515 RepID=A0ABT1XZH0_9FIRM|nr:hypothetical protein [Dehalobacterium formicoaceticum]MCR6544009.1 hypothetical protein [Dehalobacterium formicoaceticum]